MNQLRKLPDERLLFWAALILLAPALLLNLGLLPPFFHTDESRRAVVALEMLFSGNYLTPTLNGELYFNKPPLYNWIIALFFKIAGNYSYFTLRLPAIAGLLIYAYFIFRFTLEFTRNKSLAWISAMALITCGRVLFYDSFIGLIDLTYGAITFLNFMLMYRYSTRRQWNLFFTVTYAVMSVAFLMKGLSAIVFQGISVLATLLLISEWRKLFSLAHLLGLTVAALILGSYYYLYLSSNNLDFSDIAAVLWDESAKRTPAGNGFSRVLLHVLKFPIELLYDFLPWTLFLLYFLNRQARQYLWNTPFLKFCAVLFAANIAVYWISPGTMPRYLFPLLGVLFIPLVAAALNDAGSRVATILRWTFFILLALMVILQAAMPFTEATRNVPFALLVAVLVSVTLMFLMVKYYRHPARQLSFLILALIVSRIGFNWFILPSRMVNLVPLEKAALEVVSIAGNQPLLLYRLVVSPEPNAVLHNAFTYVIEANRGETLQLVREAAVPGAFYLVSDEELAGRNYTEYYRFVSEDVRTIYLVKFDG